MFIPAQISPPSFTASPDVWIWFVGVVFLGGIQIANLRSLSKRHDKLEEKVDEHLADRRVHKTTEDVQGIVRGILDEPGARRP